VTHVSDVTISHLKCSAIYAHNNNCPYKRTSISLYHNYNRALTCLHFDELNICPGCDMTLAIELVFTELMLAKRLNQWKPVC